MIIKEWMYRLNNNVPKCVSASDSWLKRLKAKLYVFYGPVCPFW